MATMMTAATSSLCCTCSWTTSSRASKLGGTNLPFWGSGKQNLSTRIGRSCTTVAQASPAVKRETETAPDDSLQAAVKGLEINKNRPDDKLPYDGVWLNVGSPSQMIHLMELPNPDPIEGRPKHGGRDRHACVTVKDVLKIKDVFEKAGVPYTMSQSGRPAVFARDPDGNALEFSQL